MDPTAIGNWISGEIAVAAHVSFWVAVGVVGILIWRGLKHHYQGRLDTKDELLKLREAQLADYKDKLSGATPDEAKARIEQLQHEVDALKPRRLTPDQMASISRSLAGTRAYIAIVAENGVNVHQLAKDIKSAFLAAGWDSGGGIGSVIGLGNPPACGLRLNYQVEAVELANRIKNAFDAAGIAIELDSTPPVMGHLSLLVTAPA